MLPKITHKELIHFLDISFNTFQPLLITGAPGLGKTMAIEQYCEVNGIDLIISHPVISMPEDFKGLPVKTQRYNTVTEQFEDVADFLAFDDLAFAMQADRPTYWFFDDCGQAPVSVQAALMQIVGGRTIAGKAISDHVRIVSATNRREDLAGVKGILEPVKSRFGMIVELMADKNSWTTWALNNGTYQSIVDFINYQPQFLHDFKPNMGMENSPCPRLWEKLSDQLYYADSIGIPEETRPKVITSCIGESAGLMFHGFEKVYRLLPTYGEIIADPDYELPNKPDLIFAFCGMLASNAKPEHHNEVFDVIDRLPGECQMYVYKSFLSVNKPMLDTIRARRWATENANLLMVTE